MGSLVVTSSAVCAVDFVDADVVVGPARVEVGAALGPGERGAAEKLSGASLVLLHRSGSDVVLDELLLGQVEDLDASLGGDDEPVKALGEEDAVDWGVALMLSEPLALNNIPNHDLTVTGTGGEERRVLNDIECGDLGLVSSEGVQQGHVQVVPNLDSLIPRGGHTECGLSCVVETNDGDGVLMVVLVDGELALGTRVPDLDIAIKGTSDDLSVIG